MKHPKTHINQINEDKMQRANIKSSKGKATNNIQVIPIRITVVLSIGTLQARREWENTVKEIKREKPTTKIIEQGSHSYSKGKSKASQTSKS